MSLDEKIQNKIAVIAAKTNDFAQAPGKQNKYEEYWHSGALFIRLRRTYDIAGMVLESRHADGRPCFTVYLPTPTGYQWADQSDNRDKEIAALRSILYADCECCNLWPCICTAEELAEFQAEYEAWAK